MDERKEEMTNEEPLLSKFDQEQLANRLLEATEQAKQLARDVDEELEKKAAEYDQIVAQAVMEEQEQWKYGHGEGILDAIESLLSFREKIGNNVLLQAIHKIANRKLFDPPF